MAQPFGATYLESNMRIFPALLVAVLPLACQSGQAVLNSDGNNDFTGTGDVDEDTGSDPIDDDSDSDDTDDINDDDNDDPEPDPEPEALVELLGRRGR